jgi:hypothetical protein
MLTIEMFANQVGSGQTRIMFYFVAYVSLYISLFSVCVCVCVCVCFIFYFINFFFNYNMTFIFKKSFTDDTQLYGSAKPSQTLATVHPDPAGMHLRRQTMDVRKPP